MQFFLCCEQISGWPESAAATEKKVRWTEKGHVAEICISLCYSRLLPLFAKEPCKNFLVMDRQLRIKRYQMFIELP